jgi:hypothetical protein
LPAAKYPDSRDVVGFNQFPAIQTLEIHSLLLKSAAIIPLTAKRPRMTVRVFAVFHPRGKQMKTRDS